ncbi:MAG: DNA repair protein RadA [Candidatus Paceibacterota bacterium]
MAQFICSECGYGSASWYGKCPSCSQWHTLDKKETEKKSKFSRRATKAAVTSLKKIPTSSIGRLATGIYEVDRVLGGGFTQGQVILLAGEPGVGKSTLLLKALSQLKTFYVSGEESAAQVKDRADRVKTSLDSLLFSDETQVESIIATAKSQAKKFSVLIIDSIQTIYSGDVSAPVGGVTQIRESVSLLSDFAKQFNKTLVIVGHVTKEGEIAGPKTLEHLVDTVLYLEGDKNSSYRVLRSRKNRFGATDEVGLFEMTDRGMSQVKAPTAFLETSSKSQVGRVIVGTVEGSRALFFEIQSLVVPTKLAMPRRVVSGVDFNRLQLLLAVIRKYVKLPLDSFDIYVNVVGGLSVKSTAADLGIVASVVSSAKNKPVSQQQVFVGEIGLLGEVRSVYGEEKVIKDARRYGFKKVISSKTMISIKEIGKML